MEEQKRTEEFIKMLPNLVLQLSKLEPEEQSFITGAVQGMTLTKQLYKKKEKVS